MIDRELLSKTLSYCPETGLLTWLERSKDLMPDLRNRCSWNAKHSGQEALRNINNNGYKIGRIMGQSILAHRAIWILLHGKIDKQIDHINGDKLDNRLCNLREVDCITNQHNKPKTEKNTSGVVGVTFHKGTNRWAAKIGSRKRAKWIGTFDSFDAAVAARKDAEIELNYHPNHGRN